MRVTFNTNQNTNYHTSLKRSTSFKQNEGMEVLAYAGNMAVNHFTALFRQTEALEVLKKRIWIFLQNADNKAQFKIVDGACSYGHETFTLAMLLNEFGKKVKILGFDISERAIKEAKKADNIYITGEGPDGFLAGYNHLTPAQENYKKLFETFFERNPESKFNFAANKIYKRNNTDFATDGPHFVRGDILTPDEFLKDSEADAFLFRNTLYHFTYGVKNAEEILDKLLSNIHRKLNRGGLFILSPKDFARDDYSPNFDYKKLSETIQQKGFTSVFKENSPFADNNFVTTIWQKTE